MPLLGLTPRRLMLHAAAQAAKPSPPISSFFQSPLGPLRALPKRHVPSYSRIHTPCEHSLYGPPAGQSSTPSWNGGSQSNGYPGSGVTPSTKGTPMNSG
eukprot:CAMPEP_0119116172 /NCGR_PEP_ID=MMETSP1180-20130426/52137_1 /TAXON_ID=3052 ORGANISM="Chlamydomonas cf sp, Strain CCMP681" /NCGR_SAMPLE_ID=MMETSP1180 /ASSEMBLY_ACC=CAM_ASM_000741 /LENGTH=98 /DNA_ID=CAMNT_0007105289 /DNA_START=522 /DNA_END=818 /DNA_ORIENTATION=-